MTAATIVLVPMIALVVFTAMVTLARMAMIPFDDVGVGGRDSARQGDRDKSQDDCVSHVFYPSCWWVTMNHRT